MKFFYSIFKKVIFIAFLLLSGSSQAQMIQLLNTFGKYQIRADACGENAVSCSITIEKPVNATTVYKAYIYYTSIPTVPDPGPNPITISGPLFPTAILPMPNQTNSNAGGSVNYTRYEDVTTLFGTGLNAAAAGTNIIYTSQETNSGDIDGVGLIVVWNNPVVVNSAIHVSIGSGAAGGLVLVTDSIITAPINTALIGFEATLGLGFSFSTGTGGQISTVSINGSVIDPVAGGYDDGIYANGGLITLGGFGDSKLTLDDEYYDFSSFIVNGSTLVKYEIVGAPDDWVNAVYFEITGVDSVVTVTDTSASICSGDSILLGGAYQTTAGVYSDTLTSYAGNDSIVNTTLTIVSFLTTNLSEFICQGDSILLGGSYQTISGAYSDTLTSNFGCDSIVTTTLTVNPIYSIIQSAVICQGESILLGGIIQTTAGVYYDSLQTIAGCDSLVSTTLTVNPVYNLPQTASICQGENILLGGVLQTTAGIYYDSLQTTLGCDSLIETTLTVHPIYNLPVAESICIGDSIFLGGSFQSTGGIYYDSLQTVFGCDSIITTTLSINPLPNINAGIDVTICLGSSTNLSATGGVSYQWDNGLGSGQNQTVNPSITTLYTVTGTDANGCVNTDDVLVTIISINATINPSSTTGLIPLTVIFGNGSSTGAGFSYEWNFGNGDTSTLFEPSYEYTETGNYLVILIVTDGFCYDTAMVYIEVIDESSVIIPNVFTPNGDGSNDFFGINGVNITFEEGEIYNRWGQLMFSWSTVGAHWDGVDAPDGTYFYIIKAKGIDDKEYLEKGTLSLFR
ncbi:MAG: hypothetical protein A3K10_05645 [Bacteroidetes bacterium RIFCSPLOWO2_12_FULL_31_6]|nr:MAG: hypothetical protein A3K10_05645 [Bacteroidetes bacterium RIFCSPLOWO2_12_FULL_31_6]